MIRNVLRRIKALKNILLDACYDARRYFRHSQSGRTDLTPDQLRGRMLQKAHSIEKGLSMPDPRDFFGLSALCELEKLVAMYEAKGLSEDHVAIRKTRGAIRAYFDRHAGKEVPGEFRRFERLASVGPAPAGIGTIALTRESQLAAAQGGLEAAMRSRRSLRMFAPGSVDADTLSRAIELAGVTTPSVCNRQSCRAYVLRDKTRVQEALALQGGNRGFGHTVDTVLIVGSDMSNFRNSDERNQGFVDGGMFAMSLLLSLHGQGLGAIPLNWSAGRKKNDRLLEMLDLPRTDLIIMMIAVGPMPESFEVAASPRRGLDELMYEVNG